MHQSCCAAARRLQYVGVPLLLLLPALALFGAFGVSFGTAKATSRDVKVTVDYATRFRYKMINPVQVTVRNTSAQTLSTVTFDRRYIDPFSNVSFTPQADRISVVPEDPQDRDKRDQPGVLEVH